MKDALIAPLFLLGLIGVCYGVGRLILRSLTAHLTFLDRFVYATALGMGVFGYSILGLGLLGIVNPIVFGVLLGAGVIGLYFLVRDVLAARPFTLPRSPLALACGCVLVLLGIFTFVTALAPPAGMEWDSLSYHLAAPKVWLRAGRIIYLPWDHHSNFPFLLEMLYLPMLSLGSISAAKLCHWLCGVLLVASVGSLGNWVRGAVGEGGTTGKPQGDFPVGSVAAVILASTPIILWEATTAYIDLATALFAWLSLKLLVVGHTPTRPDDVVSNHSSIDDTPATSHLPRTLLPSAILMGFALGTKYTVLGFWGMVLVGLFTSEVARERRITVGTIQKVALWGIVALAIGAPWFIKNIVNTGNPVYPFAYDIFGGKYWSKQNAQQYAEEQKRFGLGKDPQALLTGPWTVTMELSTPIPPGRQWVYTEYKVFALSPVFVAILLTVPFLASRLSVLSRISLLYGLGVFLFWFFVMQQTRYLIPALPAFAVVAAETLMLYAAERRLAVAGGGGLLVAASALWGIHLSGAQAFWGDPNLGLRPVWPVVSGQVPVPQYVNRSFYLGAASDWINTNTPKDSKVALFEVQGFYLDRDYIWAQPDHAEGLVPWDQYKDVDDWLQDFKKQGMTTLLLGVPLEGSDGRRWRTLLSEAIAQGKVTQTFESSGPGGIPIRVYVIP